MTTAVRFQVQVVYGSLPAAQMLGRTAVPGNGDRKRTLDDHMCFYEQVVSDWGARGMQILR